MHETFCEGSQFGMITGHRGEKASPWYTFSRMLTRYDIDITLNYVVVLQVCRVAKVSSFKCLHWTLAR
eukprot:scaffold5770_cov57-Cyclotella_meneghiniana.AAC.5